MSAKFTRHILENQSRDRDISWKPASSLSDLFPAEEQLYEAANAENPHRMGVSLPPIPTSRRAPEQPSVQPGGQMWYYADENGEREIYEPLEAEIHRWQQVFDARDRDRISARALEEKLAHEPTPHAQTSS